MTPLGGHVFKVRAVMFLWKGVMNTKLIYNNVTWEMGGVLGCFQQKNEPKRK